MPRIASPIGATAIDDSEQIQADRRVDEADLHVVGEDDQKVHGIDTHRGQRGCEDRQHQKQRRGHFQEAAEHEQQGVDRQQEQPGGKMMAEQEFDKAGRRAGFGQPMSDRECGRDDQHDARGAAQTVGDYLEAFRRAGLD